MKIAKRQAPDGAFVLLRIFLIALVAHGFDSNFLLGKFSTTDGANVPFTCGKLPKKATVALWRDSRTVHKPFHVAAARSSEFDHLL